MFTNKQELVDNKKLALPNVTFFCLVCFAFKISVVVGFTECGPW